MIHISGWRTRCLLVSLLLALGSLPAAAFAARVADLYAASVPAGEATPAAERAAFAAALGQVLVKVTGRQAAGQPEVVAGLGDPSALVQQFRRDAAGQLWALFDAAGVRRGLEQAGLPVWGEERPLTLICLLVDTGAGVPELVSAGPAGGLADALRRQLLDTAAARAVPAMLPAGDMQDRGLAEAASGVVDMELFRLVAERYPADALLVGQARVFAADAAQVDWTLLAGNRREAWSGGLADGPAGLAERLAAQLAASSGGREQVVLEVAGVESFAQYGALLAYLNGLDLVESLAVTRARDDAMQFELQLRAGRERFRQALALGHLLEGPLGDAQAGPLHYRLVSRPGH
ncbi:MAG: DUF2066 domain-containing protein [Gammaproteobacteria bacterium]|nr:DUF2066 domain-containing protein [Gammaproteobacteria bacterium]